MSGTSTDGIDVALLETDGVQIFDKGPYFYFPYEEQQKKKIQSVFKREDRSHHDCRAVEDLITQTHIKAVEAFLAEYDLSASDIDMIGFHGQTITHAPDRRLTIQLGDGKALSKALSIPVVYDFRSEDVALGGQGAPLVPVYHQALVYGVEGCIALVNIGGVSNITMIGEQGELVSFDTGPGNALIDDWVRSHGAQKGYDEGGVIARSGRVDEGVLSLLCAHSFFKAPYPKSLDRNDFDVSLVQSLCLEDGAATLTAFSAKTIAQAIHALPQMPQAVLLCGGGRKNDYLVELIQKEVSIPVKSTDEQGFNGDMIEAEAFAFLAVRAFLGLPCTFPETTGVDKALSGGVKVGFPL